MCGLTFRPASTAFFASRPAASSTLGLLVLVQLVMAAISTSPLPMDRSLPRGEWAAALALEGRLATISTTERGAPSGVNRGGTAGTSVPSEGRKRV